MKAIRLLFTSVGRRVELIQAFKSAAASISADLTIYGADADDTAPALYFCDRQIRVCRINNPCYISDLLSICQREQIDCLIPTIDTDLLLLAESKQRFVEVGTRVLVANLDRIKACRDKRLTSQYFIDCGLLAPLPVDDIRLYSGGFPCFIKPLNGSSSINAFRVDNQKDLERRAAQIFDYIIQPFIEGTEYTVDIFCDFIGNPLLITPRERIAVRTGEVLKTRIFQDEKIIVECQKLIKRFCPCGPLTIQLIRQKDTGEDYYIEINPRFGGGVPLSMKAGANAAEVLLRMLDSQGVAYCDRAAADGMVYSRFDQSICTNTDAKTVPLQAVIFDLDDTLYSEKDYVRSGFKAVSQVLPQVENVEARLWSAFEKRLPAIDTILAEDGLTDRKAECLQAYRRHKPSITLRPGMRELLVQLGNEGFALGIITDGRPEGQRAKIEALGLESLVDQIIITDELGGTVFRKPCDIAFRIMQRRLGIPFESMVYVADNVSKDFIAPIQLGMKCLQYKCSDGLYPGSSGGISSVAEPNAVYSCIAENMNNYAGGYYYEEDSDEVDCHSICKRSMNQALRSLIIVGAGGHGRVVADIATLTGEYDQIAFLDDAHIAYSGGIKVMGRVNNAKEYASFADFVIAVGQSPRREIIREKLAAIKARFTSPVHPSAVIAGGVDIGEGTAIMANAVVNTGTTIGMHSIINTGATVDHDCRIGDFVHISPGAHVSGTVEIGKGTWVGVGACIVNNVSICPGCVIGAGAVVLNSIDRAGTYVGTPAKKL